MFYMEQGYEFFPQLYRIAIDENEAIRIAKEKYEELFIKVKTNKPVRLIGVKQVIKEFNEWYLDTKSVKVKRENRQHYLNTLNKIHMSSL